MITHAEFNENKNVENFKENSCDRPLTPQLIKKKLPDI